MSTRPTVLVVDDSPSALASTARILTRDGYDVVEAVDGRRAIDAAIRHRPSLVLLDLELPDMSGIDVLHAIRSNRDLESTRVVMLSAHREPEAQADGLDSGADGYLIRPISSTELLAAVRTHLRQQELTERLRASEARFRDLITRQADGVLVVDQAGGVRFANLAAESLFGRPASELVGHPFGFPVESDVPQQVMLHPVGGIPVFAEMRVATTEWEGEPAWIISLHDVTARVRMEEELRSAQKRTRLILDAVAEGVHGLDREGRIVFENPAAVEAFGYEGADQLSGRMAHETIHQYRADGSVYPSEECPIYRTLRDGVARTVTDEVFFRADGTGFPVEYVCAPIKDEQGDVLGAVVTFRDVTAARAIEARERANSEALRESEERFRTLVEMAPEAVFVQTNSRFQYVNAAAVRLFGAKAPEDLLGQPVVDRFHPDFRDVVRERIRSLNDERVSVPASDESIVTSTGETRHVNVSAVPFEYEGSRGALVFARDITERRLLEQQFLRAQRMESIGTLAGGIAHDLNNVLAPIMMGVALLRGAPLDDRGFRIVDNIERAAKRGADLVRQVLTFARGVEGVRSTLDVRHIIQEVDAIMVATFPRNITLTTSVASELYPVLGDPTQLNQVLLNLCVNARDAMPDGGVLRVTASNREIDEQYAIMDKSVRPGRYVVIDVADTGTGMPPQVVDRIFDPFFTTKELGKGTGLGLPTALGIVRSHGGFANVYSEVGHGSTFRVHLPAAELHELAAAGTEVEKLPRGDGELVLVVDDEPTILEITRQTLEAFGYRVLTAEDGAQALATYAPRMAEVAVVLTDMMMPVMDGAALIAALRRMNPEVRIIASSGLTTHGMVGRATHAGVNGFLHKPYSADAVLKALREAISDG